MSYGGLVVAAGNTRSLIADRGDLIRDLMVRSVSVAAVTPRDDFLVETHDPSVRIQLVAMTRASTNAAQDLRCLVAFWRLLRWLRLRAVFSYTAKPVICGSLAARLAGVFDQSSSLHAPRLLILSELLQ